ncbi:hypothetical protein B0T21DRAFT_375942 [Apiosordaria backusii]|uniref:DUF7587 domain-containing protein n=1 Tax=Apiosordaria backusii TaxID=314023 RepID=A0AA40AER2_9PEZI|nr:hypothetical protein B0T21DRAFT_375942 [Apiosordaria backusii]
MDDDDLPFLMSGLVIDAATFPKSLNQQYHKNAKSIGPDDVKLYHVYDDLSQTPYREGLGICAGISDPPPGQQHKVTAKSLINHLNWSHRNATPYISLWDDWGKAEKEVERRLKKPTVFSNRTKTSTPRGDVKVAVISRNWLLQSDAFAFNLEEFLTRPENTELLTALRAKRTPISPKEWLAMHWIPDNAVTKVLTFTNTTPKQPPVGTVRQRLKTLTVQDFTECNGGSDGTLEARTLLRWHHVAPHVLKKRFLSLDGSVKEPTSKTQRKKQLGGTMRRLNREIPMLFNRNSIKLGDKLYQGLLVVGSMSDPIWRTVAPQKVLKDFQRRVVSIFRRVLSRAQCGPNGRDVWDCPENSNVTHPMTMLKNFTTWLFWEGILSFDDADMKGNTMSWLNTGSMNWVVRENRLEIEPIQRAAFVC